MTAQVPDQLINHHPRICLDTLNLYGIFNTKKREEGENELPVRPIHLPEVGRRCSALWRGYIATFHLQSDGTIELVSFDFPFTDPPVPKQHIEGGKLIGDFWLNLSPFFGGPHTNIPFRDSSLVEDRSEWQIEEQTLTGTITRSYNSGVLVSLPETKAFLPQSFLPVEMRDRLNALVGRELTCEIVYSDRNRDNFVVRPIEFLRLDRGDERF